MSNQALPPGMSAEEGHATPIAVRVVVRELRQRVARLAARLNQPSRKSSKPPSSDPPPAKPRAAKDPPGRKPGGQPGHEGHGRKLKPESAVDQLIDVRPEHCGQWGTLLLGEAADPERQQGTEVPPLPPVVTADRRHGWWWVAGGAWTQAAGPVTMPAGSFGPRVHAPVGYVTGRMGARQRAGQDLVAPVGRTDVRVGGIGALAQARSAALAAPVAEAQTDVQRQPVRNAAETSGREKRPRRGVWMSVTPLLTLCRRLRTAGPRGPRKC